VAAPGKKALVLDDVDVLSRLAALEAGETRPNEIHSTFVACFASKIATVAHPAYLIASSFDAITHMLVVDEIDSLRESQYG
jgi:hypothetical protein